MAFANPHIYIPTGLSEAQELEYIEPFAKILVDDKGADLWLHPLLLRCVSALPSSLFYRSCAGHARTSG